MRAFRFKNRKGAFAIMTAVGFFAMMIVGAVAVDFSRLWTLKNELQTAADAGALAGAIQLFPTRIAANARDTAIAYATRNKSMTRTPVVDSAIVGYWNDSLKVFTGGGSPSNAIRVVTAFQMSGLIISAFGVPLPRMRARATGWAEAPVATTGCIKPWAIPYESLIYTLNVYRGISPANSNANLNRAFDQVNDIAALNAMTAAQRTFTLKIGGGGAITAPAGGYSGSSMPGNYQAVELPKLWDAATRTYPSPGPTSGASAYRGNIDGSTCYGLSVGDSLTTEPGNMVGPTIQGIEPAVCSSIVQNGSGTGNCLDSLGNVGSPAVKAAFFACGSSCNGKSNVGVKLLGSFIIMQAYPKNFGTHEKAEITGVFQPIQSSGPVGGGSTTLQKPILIQ